MGCYGATLAADEFRLGFGGLRHSVSPCAIHNVVHNASISTALATGAHYRDFLLRGRRVFPGVFSACDGFAGCVELAGLIGSIVLKTTLASARPSRPRTMSWQRCSPAGGASMNASTPCATSL